MDPSVASSGTDGKRCSDEVARAAIVGWQWEVSRKRVGIVHGEALLLAGQTYPLSARAPLPTPRQWHRHAAAPATVARVRASLLKPAATRRSIDEASTASRTFREA
jgi:hypothetical protein